MNNNLNKIPIDINKNQKKVKKDRHKDIHFTVRISHEDHEYYTNILRVLHNVKVNGKPVLNINIQGMPSFCKMTLNYFCNNIVQNIFDQSEFINNMDDMDKLEQFIAFRAKYMNYPIDKQITDLQKTGVLTTRKKTPGQ